MCAVKVTSENKELKTTVGNTAREGSLGLSDEGLIAGRNKVIGREIIGML